MGLKICLKKIISHIFLNHCIGVFDSSNEMAERTDCSAKIPNALQCTVAKKMGFYKFSDPWNGGRSIRLKKKKIYRALQASSGVIFSHEHSDCLCA